MNKRETEILSELLSKAIREYDESNECLNKVNDESNEIEKEILVKKGFEKYGYVQGVYDTLVHLKFNHPDLVQLGKKI